MGRVLIHNRFTLLCFGMCVEICHAKMIGVDRHIEVVLQCSMWQSVYVSLGIENLYCTGGMCYGSAALLSGPHLILRIFLFLKVHHKTVVQRCRAGFRFCSKIVGKLSFNFIVCLIGCGKWKSMP